MIFLSHLTTFITPETPFENALFVNIIPWFGQLMVASFLFFSGYGIYESIKNKKGYIKNLLKNRFLPLLFNFWITVTLFIIMNFATGKSFSLRRTLLAFTGWESIGNSNWFIFATLVMYLFVLIGFKLCKKDSKEAITVVTLLTIIYMFIMRDFKDEYWFDTVICFPAGMIFSYYKNIIADKILAKKKYTIMAILSSVVIFAIFYRLNKYVHNPFVYAITSIFFATTIALAFAKTKNSLRVLSWFGGHAFWFLMIQKIPMNLLAGKLTNPLMFIVSFSITIVLSGIMQFVTDKLWSKILIKKANSTNLHKP